MRKVTILIASSIGFIVCGGMEPSARGGEVIIYNVGPNVATCSVDGYTKASGATSDITFRIEPGAKLDIPPNLASTHTTLNSIDCGGKLQTRAMNISSDGPNGTVFLNGLQKRALNVILYSSIPTAPRAGYEPLLRGLILRYQAKHPDVLLNLVLNPEIDEYDFDKVPTEILGKKGFDVAELDTVLLSFLVKNDLILPVKITGDEPWPVARQASTVDGILYGVPSWLCSDFLFHFGSHLSPVQNFEQMKKLFAKSGSGSGPGALVGDLDGSWTIAAMYIQAFLQVHPTAMMADALTMPADAEVIHRMAEFGAECKVDGSNPCIDGTYHGAKDGSVEEAFATDQASSGTGFSERSFYIAYFEQAQQSLALIPVPWGDQPHARHAMYTDAFVTNKNTCAGAECQSDSTEFAAFMTGKDTKAYIALSGDLQAGSPSRHLLVATKPFYSMPSVQTDPVYKQLMSSLLSGDMVAYPNDFSAELKHRLLSGICPSLKKEDSAWVCKAN